MLAPVLAPSVTLPSQSNELTTSNERSGGRTRPSANNPFRDNLMIRLDIPESLSKCPKGNVDIHLAWGKYKGIQAAQGLYYRMKNDGTWAEPPISIDDIMELFVSKTVFHRNYWKLFPLVTKFPALEAWLEQGSDAPLDGDVWVDVKTVYTFADLQKNLERLEKKVKKGKRKADDDGGEGKSHKKLKKAFGST